MILAILFYNNCKKRTIYGNIFSCYILLQSSNIITGYVLRNDCITSGYMKSR